MPPRRHTLPPGLCICRNPDCPIPFGECHCGCKGMTSIAAHSYSSRGQVRGYPQKFIPGHNSCLRVAPIEIRFWRKVEKNGPTIRPELGKCWLWTGFTSDGYGTIGVPTGIIRQMRIEKAHRVSWILHHGEIPMGLWVLHRCDNPPCVNPSHLFLGNHDDNIADALKKSRFARGKRNGGLFDPEQVIEIRRLHDVEGMDARRLSEIYKANHNTINGVIYRNTYRYLG